MKREDAVVAEIRATSALNSALLTLRTVRQVADEADKGVYEAARIAAHNAAHLAHSLEKLVRQTQLAQEVKP